MAAATTPRKSVSIYDYPEHLNPFHEEDNHNKIRFWTIGRKLSRSNSITFSGLKDIRNSWSLRSFMKKGKKGDAATQNSKNSTAINGEASPIVYRRGLESSSSSLTPPSMASRTTLATPERSDRYVYGGSITPLPRSRFQERLRSASTHEVSTLRPGAIDQNISLTPRMARSDVSGSQLSVNSTNPFDECPVPPVRASKRRKKRVAPPPPTSLNSSMVSGKQLDVSAISEDNESRRQSYLDEDLSINVELKIVEDDDIKKDIDEEKEIKINEVNDNVHTVTKNGLPHKLNIVETKINHETDAKEDKDDNDVAFVKVDIRKYRRNSSMNEDEIKLRRDNKEDFTPIATRSKSLTNAMNFNNNYVTYDINSNTDVVDNETIDSNGNAKKVVCKIYNENSRKQSIETVSSTEREFIEIQNATKELEREISKLNLALKDDEPMLNRISVTDMRKKFDNTDKNTPNPIPKPKRSNRSPSPGSPVNT